MTELRAPYSSIVYQDGDQYVARDGRGNLLKSLTPPDSIDDLAAFPFPNPGDDARLLLQAALNRAGDIYIAGGEYRFDDDFRGLDVRSFSRISVAKDAALRVPRGFAHSLFTFSGVQNTVLEGGFYFEEGAAGDPEKNVQPASRNWTLVRLVGDVEAGDACHSNVIRDMRSWYVGRVIHLNAASDQGFCNSNRFSNFSVFAYKVGIEFAHAGLFQRNSFDNLIYQTHPELTALAGAGRIRGASNTFVNVYFYDAIVAEEERITGNVARIMNDATGTLIVGGIMTSPSEKFVDDGVGTQIVDEWHVV